MAAAVVVALVAGAALAVMAATLMRFRQASAFGSLVEHAPVGVGHLDRQLRYVRVTIQDGTIVATASGKSVWFELSA